MFSVPNNVKKEFSRNTVWRAANSEYGDRLTEITREHVTLAKELILYRKSISANDREIYTARIAQLRQECDAIIQKFEGGTTQ
jgi:hypothetical protein